MLNLKSYIYRLTLESSHNYPPGGWGWGRGFPLGGEHMDFRGNRGDQSSPTEYKEGTTQNGLPMRVRGKASPGNK